MKSNYIIIVGMTIAIIAVFFIVFANPQEELAPTINVLEYPKKAFVGEKTEIKVEATDKTAVHKIILKSQLGQKEKECKKEECILIFTEIFDNPGSYNLEFIAVNTQGKQSSKKIILKVFEDQDSCIDNTPLGSCSKTKPLHCLNKQLVEKCEECGCPDGTECVLGACKVVSGKLEFASAAPLPAKIVKAGSDFSIKAIIQNATKKIVLRGATYLLKAELGGAQTVKTEKTITLQRNLEQNITQEFELEIEGLEEGIYSLKLELVADNQTIDSYYEESFVESSSDSMPPLPPTGLAYEFVNEDLELSWNANSEQDLAGYKIYKSHDIQPTHIKYSFLQEVGADTTSIKLSDLSAGKHFFVLKAFDLLSNESAYSQTIKVEKS